MNEIKINKRRFKVKKSQDYTIPSKGMIVSWRVVDDVYNVIPILRVNDTTVKVPRKDSFTISIPEIRNYIRSDESIDSPYRSELDSLENIFYNYQLYGTEYYKSLSNKELFDSLFTRDIKLQLYFGVNGPSEVEIEEEYWDRKGSVDIDMTNEDIEMQKELNGIEPLKVLVST